MYQQRLRRNLRVNIEVTEIQTVLKIEMSSLNLIRKLTRFVVPCALPVRPDDGPGAGKVEGEVGAAPAEPVCPAALVALLGPAHRLGDHALVLGVPDGHHVAAPAAGRLATAAAPTSTSGVAAAAAAGAALGHGRVVCSCPRLWIAAATVGSDVGSLVLIWCRLF